MFDYTRAIINKTSKDLSTAITVYNFGTQIIYIAYLIYLLLTPNDIWYLHLSLLIVSCAFFIFDLITTGDIRAIRRDKLSFFSKRKYKERLTEAKKRRKIGVKVKFYTSHVINVFVLASAFYPIIVAPDTVHPLSIMYTTVMVLLWILRVVLEVIKIVLTGRTELFMEALSADVEFVTKPVNAVKDTFKKLMGKEIEEKQEPSKDRRFLDGLVKSAKDEKSAKKAEEKAAKSEKLSAWLDTHLSKLTAKRSAKSSSAKTEAIDTNDGISELEAEKTTEELQTRE